MSNDVNIRYSDSDLTEFKKLINEKIDKAKHDLELIKSAYMNDHNNGTEDQLASEAKNIFDRMG